MDLGETRKKANSDICFYLSDKAYGGTQASEMLGPLFAENFVDGGKNLSSMSFFNLLRASSVRWATKIHEPAWLDVFEGQLSFLESSQQSGF